MLMILWFFNQMARCRVNFTGGDGYKPIILYHVIH
ncbi:EC1118_1D0_2091p [Saccharomyces cerevisiae EC1118]|uniref:EC1118_1D0_2091p n=1 Tax=Saccharomyces cerevisiae (strain Lalvin EC1118 / Prise de mousse) TaxID=643680 RepID=C8Z4P4_YEAS8|nr:EC1118_1D0_2091p [Saccharomyces cerevisiae EC1118]